MTDIDNKEARRCVNDPWKTYQMDTRIDQLDKAALRNTESSGEEDDSSEGPNHGFLNDNTSLLSSMHSTNTKLSSDIQSDESKNGEEIDEESQSSEESYCGLNLRGLTHTETRENVCFLPFIHVARDRGAEGIGVLKHLDGSGSMEQNVVDGEISLAERFVGFTHRIHDVLFIHPWDAIFEYHTCFTDGRKFHHFSTSTRKSKESKGSGQKSSSLHLIFGLAVKMFVLCSAVQGEEINLIQMEMYVCHKVLDIQCTICTENKDSFTCTFSACRRHEFIKRHSELVDEIEGKLERHIRAMGIATLIEAVLALVTVCFVYPRMSLQQDVYKVSDREAENRIKYRVFEKKGKIISKERNTSFYDLVTLKVINGPVLDRFSVLYSFISLDFGVDRSGNRQKLELRNFYKSQVKGFSHFKKINGNYNIEVFSLNGVNAYPLILCGFNVNDKSASKIILKGTDDSCIQAYVHYLQYCSDHVKTVEKPAQSISSLIRHRIHVLLQAVLMCWIVICNEDFSSNMSDFVFKDNRKIPVNGKYKYMVKIDGQNRKVNMINRKGFLKTLMWKPWTSIYMYPLPRNSVDSVLKRYFSPSPPTRMETMAYEILRLCTMHDYPNRNGQSCIRMAQAGFFYEGKGDEVTCFSCGVKIGDWNQQQDPLVRHRRSSPSCRFICHGENNVPVQYTTQGTEDVPEASGHGNARTNDTSTTNTSEGHVHEQEETSNTSESNTINQTATHRNQCKGTLFPQQAVACDASGNLEYGSSNASQRNTGVTTSVQERVPVRSSSSDSGSARYQPSFNVEHRAKYPAYVLEPDRVNSFPREWTTSPNQTPSKMAKSGFFYAGYSDCVRCFDCGIGLRNWEYPDNPDVEHARWSPRCSYLLGSQGQGFINSVLEAVARFIARNGEESGATSNGNANESMSETNGSSSGSMATSNGNSSDSVAASNGNSSGSSANSEAVPSENQTDGNKNKTADSTELLSSRDNKEQTERQKKSSNEKFTAAVLKRGYSQTDIKLAIQNIVKAKGRVSEGNILKELESRSRQTVTVTRQVDDAIKKKNIEMRKLTLCKICLEDEVTTVFLPCGHLVSCSQCSNSLSRCAICRTQITGSVHALLDD